MLRRRTLLATAVAGLAAPSVRAQPARVLRFVPYVDLPLLDPVSNTAAQVRTHGFMVWDTLYGLDADYVPRLQMLAGQDTSADGLTWRLTLRPGQMFHDGTPVLAADAVASIRRWASTDGFGGTLMAATNELDAPDDRTIRFRLKKPFPLLPDALGKMSPSILPIMPARIAAAPANKPVSEIIGSGPFRFIEKERVAGSRLVYERFDGYSPADGPPASARDLTSGAKIVNLDRVEWVTMPEAGSAAAALRAGEVDWLDAPPPDLLPLLRRDAGVTVRTNDTTGVCPILRFNTLHPPFDNVAIRRAVLAATQQREFMAAFSDDPENALTGFATFCPGTPMASSAGVAASIGSMDIAAARRAIAAAGYQGERVVMMEPTDHPVNSVMSQVGADLFKKLGFAVDDQAMDAGTMFQRRASKEPVDRGGWSCFPSAVAGIDVLNPAVSFLTLGNGLKSWYGWPSDPELETLRLAWYDAPDRPGEQAIAQKIQLRLMSQAPYLPLGQILQPTAYRKNLGGMIAGFAKFWGVSKG